VDCQQGKGRVTSVIGGQANTASRGRISDPEDIAADAGQQIEQACASLSKEVGGRTVAQLSQAHEKANPPLEINIQADGFEAALRQKIRRPRGEILKEDYERVGSINASSRNGNTANLKDLRFVQKLTELKRIAIDAQSISDLKPLAGCVKLDAILLDDTRQLSTIRNLEVLGNIKMLRLAGLDSVKAPESTLRKLSGLNRLMLIGRLPIESWDFVTDLTQLTTLTVHPVADFPTIANLKSLKNLEVYMENSKKIPDVTVFKDFQHLDKLWINFYRSPLTLTADDLNKLKVMLPGVEIKVTGGK